MILQKQEFMNPARDGGNMPRKWQNSAKSEKVGISAVLNGNHIMLEVCKDDTV